MERGLAKEVLAEMCGPKNGRNASSNGIGRRFPTSRPRSTAARLDTLTVGSCSHGSNGMGSSTGTSSVRRPPIPDVAVARRRIEVGSVPARRYSL